MAGYSGTPLVKKLGIKENARAVFLNAPEGFVSELGLPSGVRVNSKQSLDFAMLFVKNKSELERKFPALAARLNSNAMFWISWPKRASGVATDLTEDVVRAIGIANAMVDVKVCAVDEVWSGLKFVFRLKDRATRRNGP